MPKIAFFEVDADQQDYLTKTLAGLPAQSGQSYSLLFFKDKFDPKLLAEHKDTEAISVFVGSRVQAAELTDLPNLKIITTRSTGFDHLDITGLGQKGIRLGYVPGYGDNTVAEFAFGLLLAVVRKICVANAEIRVEGKFSIEGYGGFDLLGKTMGVIGTGRIGKHAIRIANGFGMKVLAYDINPDPALESQLHFEYAAFDELLQQSDVISLHVPYFEKTHHLINEAAFSKMKPGAILINTARGAVVDTQALLKALQSGRLAGAGLDVLEGEEHITDEVSFLLYGKQTEQDIKTLAGNLVLVDLPNVVITPHIAFFTTEALHRILDTDMSNLTSFFSSGNPAFDILASKRVTLPASPSASLGESSPQGGGK